MDNLKTQASIAGLIYAGGRGLRMGGVDKALLPHQGEPLIASRVRSLSAFVEHIFITRQADQGDISSYGQVIIDGERDQGPLAGLIAGIQAAQNFDYLLTIAVDGTKLPPHYLSALQSAKKPHALARSADHIHSTYALIDLSQTNEILESYQNGQRALRSWAHENNTGYALFATDELENINQIP